MIEPINRPKAARPTVADLARAAGVSVATIDRVINNRLPVRSATALRVHEAAQAIGFHAAGLINRRLASKTREMTCGFILQRRSSQFYQALGDALEAATLASTAIRGRAIIEYLDDLTPLSVGERLRMMAARVDAVAVVAADHPHITQAIAELHERRKPVVALVTDLSAPLRAGYVGLDWRQSGRTAGWAMMRLAKPDGKIAIIVGSHRYQAQELCEISFRSYLREHAPQLHLLEPLVSLEDPRLAYESMGDLLRRTPDLAGIYVAGGGIEGVMQALRESDNGRAIVTVGLDLTEETRAGLIDGVLDLVMSHPRSALAAATVEALRHAVERLQSPLAADGSPAHSILPMDVFTPENV